MVQNVIYHKLSLIFESARKERASWRHLLLQMTPVMALDGVRSVLRLKDVTNTSKRMRHSQTICGNSSVQWRKGRWNWRLQMWFRRLVCVRIEIDQLSCVNCWEIIHCLSVSCTKINHSHCALLIWSSWHVQLTSKQWIITQQFTARADLFLKYNALTNCLAVYYSMFVCWVLFWVFFQI